MDGLKDVIESDAKRLAKIVGEGAPIIAALLGSPIASMALSLLAAKFGLAPGSITNLLSSISADPDSLAKLKEIEAQHGAALSDIARQNFSTEVQDKEDARKYSVLYKDFLRHMAFMVTAGFFAALFLLFVPLNLNADEKNLLSMLVGMLASKWQTIIDFFYGSSRPQHHGGFTNG